jgi:hypothetical protein
MAFDQCVNNCSRSSSDDGALAGPIRSANASLAPHCSKDGRWRRAAAARFIRRETTAASKPSPPVAGQLSSASQLQPFLRCTCIHAGRPERASVPLPDRIHFAFRCSLGPETIFLRTINLAHHPVRTAITLGLISAKRARRQLQHLLRCAHAGVFTHASRGFGLGKNHEPISVDAVHRLG